GGPLRIEPVLFLPAPLDAHWPADGARDQRRLGGGVVGAVRSVRAGSVEVDHADALALDAEHAGAGVLKGVDVLGRAPHGGAAGPDAGAPAGGPDRAVGLDGPAVRRGERARTRMPRREGGEVSARGDLLVADDAASAHRLVLLR